jgi:ribose transport system ATP-binding protein
VRIRASPFSGSAEHLGRERKSSLGGRAKHASPLREKTEITMMLETPQILLEARGVTKRYGATTALLEAAFELRSGEVHALLGSNGSGKSTLAKIVAGLVAPDSGDLQWRGSSVKFRNPLEARAQGIAVVYQELSLVPDLSVEANIWLGHELRGAWGRVNASETQARTLKLLELFKGVTREKFLPETLAGALPPDERQLVEILKALSLEPQLLILDEATASLDARQVERVFELVTDLKSRGLGIVIVTHRMDEIFQIADRATALRNGQVVGRVNVRETTRKELVTMIIGEVASVLEGEAKHHTGTNAGTNKPAILKLESLRSGKLRDLKLELAPGEIVGLGGLQGQGQSELLLTLFGEIPLEVGTLRLENNTRNFTHPRDAMDAGIAFVPGDRNRQGLLASRNIFENFLLPGWDAFRNGPFIKSEQARNAALSMGEKLKLKYGSLEHPITSLSGGNAQKVVLGKWLMRNPRVLLLDDPTKGIDVGAKAEFYKLLGELREAGLAVLFYSSDDDELLNLCDRVLVMLEGKITNELSGPSLNRTNLVRSSLGAA